CTGDASHIGLATEASIRSYLARDARHFRSERAELVHHRVDRVLQLQDFTFHIDRDFLREIAVRDRGCHFGDVAYLTCQIAGHEIHAVGQIFPRPRDTAHISLTTKSSFGTDFARHARYLRGERTELVHHCVNGVFEFPNFPPHVDGDLLRQIAACDRGGDFSNVTHLTGQVTGHEVHRVSQVFPGAGNVPHVGLAAEFSFRTHLARHARDFRSERTETINQGVDRVFHLENLALHVNGDLSRQVAICDRCR